MRAQPYTCIHGKYNWHGKYIFFQLGEQTRAQPYTCIYGKYNWKKQNQKETHNGKENAEGNIAALYTYKYT